jgi:hypothetical protein
MPQWVVELLACWRGQFESHCSIDVWKMVLLCLMWCIWKEHKAQNFKNYEWTVLRVKNHNVLIKKERVKNHNVQICLYLDDCLEQFLLF